MPGIDMKQLDTVLKEARRFKPAPANHGIRFQRVDLPGDPVVGALVENVQDTQRGTTIGEGAAVVHTVEHVLSTLAGLEIDNVLIEINGRAIQGADDITEVLRARAEDGEVRAAWIDSSGTRQERTWSPKQAGPSEPPGAKGSEKRDF